MPRGDRTGPNGMGPMTGRGAGLCAGFDSPGFVNGGFARFEGGRGFAWRARAVPVQQVQPVITKGQEKTMLEADLGDLKAEIKAVEKRLKELK